MYKGGEITNIKEYKYILGQSNTVSIDCTHKKINLDLGLLPNKYTCYGKVYGIVKDNKGCPIKGALIKIMKDDYEPLLHVTTDEDGVYLFNKVPKNINLKIFAVAFKKKLTQGYRFSIVNNESIKRNFLLKNDNGLKLGIIAGDLLDLKSDEPIKGAVIFLYKKCNNKKILDSITYTNKYGQYTFREVNIGCYIIKISALGYYDKYIDIAINKCGQIFSMIVKICPHYNISKGTVSGVIIDNNDNPINNADVILYKVKKKGLIPIAFTRTNKSGVYLFINVPKGNYKIKANEIKIIDINLNVEDNVKKY